jgi:predicted AlkP superfamily pyrophosphatase or phosphodiesterase
VPPDAEFGPRDLELVGKKGARLSLSKAFYVCSPLVVIVNIDGMRQDVLYSALSGNTAMGPEACPTLRGLVGKPAGNRLGQPGTPLHRLEFEHGIALPETATVFPSVTFGGHAAIATGADLNQVKMAGNEWFDRFTRYKYAFTGDNIGVGQGDAIKSFADGFANDRLLKSGRKTLYQEANADPKLGVTSLVMHNMYFGASPAAKWQPQRILPEQAVYFPHWSTHFNDQFMTSKASLHLNVTEKEQPRFAILMLYFPGLDHDSHIGKSPRHVEDRDRTPGKQSIYLANVVDPCLGSFMQDMNEPMLKNTFFVFTADHGQTTMAFQESTVHHLGESRSNPGLHKFQDLLYELGYSPHGNYRVLPRKPPFVNPPEQSTAVLGLNGGMAHVYLRRIKGDAPPTPRVVKVFDPRAPDDIRPILAKTEEQFDEWSVPPLKSQVHDAARRFWQWSKDGWAPHGPEPELYRGSIELVLWRDTQNDGYDGHYRVYDPGSDSITFLDFLLKDLEKNGDNSFLKRHGWNDRRDAEFLADRLRRLQGPMSGDLILLPRYPYFYCEYVTQYGDHGSFNRNDMQVPFVVAQAGADEQRMKFIKKVLADPRVIDLRTKNRPCNSDVKKTVLELLRTPPFDTKPDPTFQVVYSVEPRASRKTGDGKFLVTEDRGKVTVTIGVRSGYKPVQGAHVLIQAGQRTTHAWVPRQEGGRKFGVVGHDIYEEVTVGPAGTTVTLTADADGKTATASFSLSLDPQAAARLNARRAKELDQAKGDVHGLQVEGNTASIKDCQEKIAKLGKSVSETDSKTKTFLDASIAAACKRELARARIELQGLENERAILEASYQAEVARINGDPVTQFGQQQRVHELVKARATFHHKATLAEWEAEDWLYSRGDAPADYRKSYNERKAARKTEDPSKDDYVGPSGSDIAAALELACAVGDEASLRELATRFIDHQLKLAVAAQQPFQKRPALEAAASAYLRYAELLVRLTGNREEAAALWVKGEEIFTAESGRESVIGLPAWWPEGNWQPPRTGK